MVVVCQPIESGAKLGSFLGEKLKDRKLPVEFMSLGYTWNTGFFPTWPSDSNASTFRWIADCVNSLGPGEPEAKKADEDDDEEEEEVVVATDGGKGAASGAAGEKGRKARRRKGRGRGRGRGRGVDS